MERVSLFTTISYRHPDAHSEKISKLKHFFQTCENYFYWGGKKDYVIPGKKN